MALYKRHGSKYWWTKFTFGGQLVQQSTKCSSKKDALTVEGAYRTELALGKVGISPKRAAPAFKQAAADFLKWSQITHAQKPNSHARLKHSCRPLIDFFGATRVDLITRKHVEEFILRRSKHVSRKTGAPVTPDTVNLELGALKAIFKRLAAEKCIRENPAKDVKRLAANERNFYVLSEAEEKLYLMACPQPLRDVAILMLETGMRNSEVYRLTRSDVSLEKGYLKIRGGKTRSSNRKIWLNDKAAEVLRGRLEKFSGENLFPVGDVDGREATGQINRPHQVAVDRAGLKFRLYDCRHTFATRAVESGVDLLTLAHLLGHSNLNEVMRYAHVNEKRKGQAIRQMQKRKGKSGQKSKKATFSDTPAAQSARKLAV